MKKNQKPAASKGQPAAKGTTPAQPVTEEPPQAKKAVSVVDVTPLGLVRTKLEQGLKNSQGLRGSLANICLSKQYDSMQTVLGFIEESIGRKNEVLRTLLLKDKRSEDNISELFTAFEDLHSKVTLDLQVGTEKLPEHRDNMIVLINKETQELDRIVAQETGNLVRCLP